MATKKYDLAVKTGTYTKDGEEKGRYENVGAIWEGDNGPYLVLKRTFNPAGVPFKDGSDSIFISMFAPKDETEKGPRQRPARTDYPEDDSDIPFN